MPSVRLARDTLLFVSIDTQGGISGKVATANREGMEADVCEWHCCFKGDLFTWMKAVRALLRYIALGCADSS